MYVWNAGGPVYGPNGELELDPDNQQCNTWVDGRRPVFATCKNNCPGGELVVVSFKHQQIKCLSSFEKIIVTQPHLIQPEN